MSQWHRYIALTNPVHFLFYLNFLKKLSRPFKYLHNKRQIRFCQLSHYYLILKHVSSIYPFPYKWQSKIKVDDSWRVGGDFKSATYCRCPLSHLKLSFQQRPTKDRRRIDRQWRRWGQKLIRSKKENLVGR